MRKFPTAPIAFAMLSAACLAQNGVVKSEGQAIQGATVKATQGDRVLMTLTDDSGAFHFDRMTPGSWIVEVDMFGFTHARKEVEIGANPTKVDFTLQLRERIRPGARFQEAAVEAEGTTLLPSAAADAPPGIPQAPVDGSNESFLVNGSLSQGLQTQAGDLREFGGPGGLGGPGGFGAPPGGNPAGNLADGPGAGGLQAGGPPGGRGGGGSGRLWRKRRFRRRRLWRPRRRRGRRRKIWRRTRRTRWASGPERESGFHREPATQQQPDHRFFVLSNRQFGAQCAALFGERVA